MADRPVPTAKPTAPRAPDADLDRGYRALLARLQLADRHREQLYHRGLSGSDVDRAEYRSLPTGCRARFVKPLQDLFASELLMTVPGIIARDGAKGRYLTLAGAPGLLIPVRSAARHVVGLVVRPDDPGEGGKYRWVSSSKDGGRDGLPSPGWRVHVPAGMVPRSRVVLVEGILKADVCAALAPGRSIIGLPGCRVTDEAIDTLRQLETTEALLAMDTDAAANLQVADALIDGLHRIKTAGFIEGLVRWDPALGKGLDDALLSMRRARA